MAQKIRVALCQMHMVWQDKEANLRQVASYIEEAAANNAQMILFPEMTLTGFAVDIGDLKEAQEESLSIIRQLAKDAQIAVGLGWAKDCGLRAENHYTFVDETGMVLADYAKIHPFSYAGETKYFQGGNEIVHFTWHEIPMSIFICYDLRFPEVFVEASEKAHMILLPADWPASRADHWKTLIKARAIENQCYMLAVNSQGECGGLYYSGDSAVINPNGEVLAAMEDQPGLLYCELTDDADAYREAFPMKQDRGNRWR